MKKITLDVDPASLDEAIVEELKNTLATAEQWRDYTLKADRKYYKKLSKHLKTVIKHFSVGEGDNEMAKQALINAPTESLKELMNVDELEER